MLLILFKRGSQKHLYFSYIFTHNWQKSVQNLNACSSITEAHFTPLPCKRVLFSRFSSIFGWIRSKNKSLLKIYLSKNKYSKISSSSVIRPIAH